LKKTSSFSPRRNSSSNDRVPVTYATLEEYGKGEGLAGDSLWLSRKMVEDGCTLEQTLHLMEERCKTCNVATPMFCVEQCETWKVKKELRDTDRELSEVGHKLRLLNALKNGRRLAILDVLRKGPLSLAELQERLKDLRLYHSQKTLDEYLKPLLAARLVRERNGRWGLTLYGRKVQDAVVRHGFGSSLPVHSGGREETILRGLLDGPRTCGELAEVVPAKSLSRVLKRLRERRLISDNSPSDRVFYFRTKRALSLERLSPTQKRMCEAIPDKGVSARELSVVVGINLRRVYRYLRGLRGKKLAFRRAIPAKYELTERGRKIAEFLLEITGII
jgi:DNA-binding HxlR family transcriptional regulator/predicted transcriptional regulator